MSSESSLSPEDRAFLKEAVFFFERPTAFTRALNTAGDMVGIGFSKLPAPIKDASLRSSKIAIEQCLKIAVKTMDESEPIDRAIEVVTESSRLRSRMHTIVAGVSGGIGGFMGPTALLVELPLTTAIIMRSIASTAKDFGFDPRKPEVYMECLFVFAIGGPSKSDDEMDSSYISSKLAFASLIKKAAGSVAGLSAKQALVVLETRSAPALVRFMTSVAEIFGIRISQKMMAQMAPVIGAVGGASLNVAFTNFFGTAARYHFGMKRLESRYGAEQVSAAYREELEALS